MTHHTSQVIEKYLRFQIGYFYLCFTTFVQIWVKKISQED